MDEDCLSAPARAGATFTGLGDLAGGQFASAARGVSADGSTVAFMGQQLLGIQAQLQSGATLKEVFGGTPPGEMNTSISSVPPEAGEHMSHGARFGAWTRYANWLGASFLIYFALKSVGVIRTGGQCFARFGQWSAEARQCGLDGLGW